MSQWTAMMTSPQQKAPMEINGTVKRGREADPEPDTGRRQAKSQKPGKGRGKPSRRQEDNGSTNNQQGDQEPKSLRKLVNLIAQLSRRQEDQLAIWRQDHSYVIFLQTDPRITVVPQLHQIGVKWQEKRSAAPASPGLPLRVVLLNCLGRRQLKLHELRCVQPQVPGGERSSPHPPAKHGRPPTSSARPGTHAKADREVSCNKEALGEHAGRHSPLHVRSVSPGSRGSESLRPLRLQLTNIRAGHCTHPGMPDCTRHNNGPSEAKARLPKLRRPPPPEAGDSLRVGLLRCTNNSKSPYVIRHQGEAQGRASESNTRSAAEEAQRHARAPLFLAYHGLNQSTGPCRFVHCTPSHLHHNAAHLAAIAWQYSYLRLSIRKVWDDYQLALIEPALLCIHDISKYISHPNLHKYISHP